MECFTLVSQQDSCDLSHEINSGILRSLRKEMSSGKSPLQGMHYKINNAVLYMQMVYAVCKTTVHVDKMIKGGKCDTITKFWRTTKA